MDGEMVEYEGAGCTTFEEENADTGPCISPAEEAADPDGFPAGTIDRSGTKAPRTPDWKFVVDARYWMPLFDNYKTTFSARTSFIDAYVNDIEGFSQIISYDQRILTNLNLGIGDMDDSWELSFWVRNLFNDGIKYFPEFDVEPVGRRDYGTSLRNYRTYGVQLNYNFN
jgi:hypothetical protein